METLLITGIIVLALAIILAVDYFGPNSIRLRDSIAFGMKCLRAKELIVQQSDSKGNIWASRGFILYKLSQGSTRFMKHSRIPVGFSLLWLNNFSVFRKLTLRAECIEMVIDPDGTICTFCAGSLWQKRESDRHFKKTGTMPNFGRKVGRGVMTHGLMAAGNGVFYFGEYFNNPDRIGVAIYEYNENARQWIKVYMFSPGQIRHIHSLQSDPYTGILWVCTGDENDEPMIGWSDDGFKSIYPIGQGSQIWRACQLVFTEEAIYWGTDTGSEELSGMYRWDKQKKELERLNKTEGALFYSTRLADGTIVMSTDREKFPNEKDNRTRLYLLDQSGKITNIICGSWDYSKPGFRFNFAKLRLQRNQGNPDLIVSVLNQKEFDDGELLIFNSSSLLH